MPATSKKVGLIVGREWSWPPAFIEEVNRRDQGVTAEYVTLGTPHLDDPGTWRVIIDRISHEVPFYRTYLKHAVLRGVTVVNNPFMWSADDKFFGATLAASLGVATPKTVLLPNKEYVPGVVHTESLRNLAFPLDWQAVVDYVGLPCVLKDAYGGRSKPVVVCHSVDDLLHHYDQSGLLTMIVQEMIGWDEFVRCLAIGRQAVRAIKYHPATRKYHESLDFLAPDLHERIVRDTLALTGALGYDINSLEWAVKNGVPYAIDFMNPAPDLDIYSLTPVHFEWAVKATADLAIRLAKAAPTRARPSWESFLKGGPAPRRKRG